MKIYVSTLDDIPTAPFQDSLNSFIKNLTPCPCGSDELILRYGHNPYLVCLSCGKCHQKPMGGIPLNWYFQIEVPHYLKEWREGGNVMDQEEFFRFVSSPSFKIVTGGEESETFNVEPVDREYHSKLEDLKRRVVSR
jgi:hypothetical protein